MASRCCAKPIDNSGVPPWQQGYELAEALQNELGGCVEGEPIDVDVLLKRLEVDVAEVTLSDESIRGVAIAGPQYRSGIVWNRDNRCNDEAWGRRFTLAHELCHLLFDRNVGQRLAVASGPWAPPSLEKRANAFASMLLMPTVAVRRVVADMNEPVSTKQGIETVAQRLQVGFRAALSHLYNLRFVDDSSRQRIEPTL